MTRQENAEKREKIGRKDLTDIRGIPYIIDVARMSRAQKEDGKMRSEYVALIEKAVDGASLTTWHYGHGGRHDAIRIPHPIDCGETTEEGSPPHCWGDYPSEVVEEINRRTLAALAPGRVVVDGGGDEDGEYSILADLKKDDD